MHDNPELRPWLIVLAMLVLMVVYGFLQRQTVNDVRELAYSVGYEAGFDAGYDEGHERGLEDANLYAFDDGYEEGYKVGYYDARTGRDPQYK